MKYACLQFCWAECHACTGICHAEQRGHHTCWRCGACCVRGTRAQLLAGDACGSRSVRRRRHRRRANKSTAAPPLHYPCPWTYRRRHLHARRPCPLWLWSCLQQAGIILTSYSQIAARHAQLTIVLRSFATETTTWAGLKPPLFPNSQPLNRHACIKQW